MKTLPATGTPAAFHLALADRVKEKPAGSAGEGAAPDAETVKKWLDEYDGLQAAGGIAFEKARKATFTELQNQVGDAGFDLAPASFLGRWDDEKLPDWASGLCPLVAHFLVHLLGVLMTAGLLALGAPFWFNLLKNLMSLRPAVAALIEKRPNSAPVLPTSPATPPAPS